MTKLVFIHVPIRNMYFLSGMEGFKKSEGRSTRGASSLQNWLRPPPQNWMRPYDSCSSAPTALMKKLSTANLLSIHVLILRIFVFGGATRIVGAGSRQSQIGLSKGVLSANPLPGASGLGKLTMIYLQICILNHHEIHQTNPLAPWDFLGVPIETLRPPSTPLNPRICPLTPLNP